MQKRFKTQFRYLAVLWLTIALLGCGTTSRRLLLKDMTQSFEAGSIISGSTGKRVTYEAMIKDLADVRIVYVGENHRDINHHQIQLQIIQSLFNQSPNLVVGMEMFDRAYQPVLDQWTKGELDEKTFLKQVHWYANWKYDYKFY